MGILIPIAAVTMATLLSAERWTAHSGPVTVSVDPTTFSYNIVLQNNSACPPHFFDNGAVSIQCGGFRYSYADGVGNLTAGPVTTRNGTDPALGAFRSIQRAWTAGTCTEFTTEIREYLDSIEFVTQMTASKSAANTATESKLTVKANLPVTEFPSLVLPNASNLLSPLHQPLCAATPGYDFYVCYAYTHTQLIRGLQLYYSK